MADLSRVNSFSDIELKMFALKLVIETLNRYTEYRSGNYGYVDFDNYVKSIYPFPMTINEKQIFFSKIYIRVEHLLYRLQYINDYNTFDDISNISTVLSFIINKIKRVRRRVDEISNMLDHYVSSMYSALRDENEKLHED